jgi:3-hydroxyisobutyrate dehydrogenase-like beta-hydroxyacid dehydrogenase
MLAAANPAAGAEALAIAQAAGLDLQRVCDVVNASSGASWIFADRVGRALTGDYVPRAATRLLDKDVGIAAALAERLGVNAPLTRVATSAFAAAMAAGCAEDDDAVLVRLALDASRRRSDR